MGDYTIDYSSVKLFEFVGKYYIPAQTFLSFYDWHSTVPDTYTCEFLHQQLQFKKMKVYASLEYIEKNPERPWHFHDDDSIFVNTIVENKKTGVHSVENTFIIKRWQIQDIIQFSPTNIVQQIRNIGQRIPHYFIFFQSKQDSCVKCVHVIDKPKAFHGILKYFEDFVRTFSTGQLNKIKKIAQKIGTQNVTVAQYKTMLSEPVLRF